MAFKSDFRFMTPACTSISSAVDDKALAEFIRQSDYIRAESLRRTWAIPSMPYKSTAWKNKYYDHFRAQILAELS